MDSQLIRVLLVEDDEDDFFLVKDLFAEIQGQRFHLERVNDYDAGLVAMDRKDHDVYLLDYRLNGQTGLDLLREARGQGCQGPIILLTGQGERDVDLDAMKAGVGRLPYQRSIRCPPSGALNPLRHRAPPKRGGPAPSSATIWKSGCKNGHWP